MKLPDTREMAYPYSYWIKIALAPLRRVFGTMAITKEEMKLHRSHKKIFNDRHSP